MSKNISDCALFVVFMYMKTTKSAQSEIFLDNLIYSWPFSVKKKNLLLMKKFSVKSTRYLVISLVKPLLSRNFCHKCLRVNFHSVCSSWFHEKFLSVIQYHSLEKCTIKRDHDFYGKINIFSVKATYLLKKLLKSWFHEIFWEWSRFIVLFHTHSVVISKISPHDFLAKIPSKYFFH